MTATIKPRRRGTKADPKPPPNLSQETADLTAKVTELETSLRESERQRLVAVADLAVAETNLSVAQIKPKTPPTLSSRWSTAITRTWRNQIVRGVLVVLVVVTAIGIVSLNMWPAAEPKQATKPVTLQDLGFQ